MLLCCRLTAPTLQPLKSMPSTSMSSRIIWRPPSAESWARDCPRVWGRGLPARGSGRWSLTWKGCLLSPRAPKYCRRQSWTADTGVNEMLMHETQPTCVVMRAWHSYNLKFMREFPPLGNELVTCIRDESMALVQLDVGARGTAMWEFDAGSSSTESPLFCCSRLYIDRSSVSLVCFWFSKLNRCPLSNCPTD